MIVCSSCGQETPEGFPRCANYGAPPAEAAAPVREVRKVVTVLFCDLVGSTARARSVAATRYIRQGEALLAAAG